MFSEFAMKKNPERLATAKRSPYCKMMAKAQGGLDWITGARLRKPRIDHDHDTGHCRLILNSNTNTFEGRLKALLGVTLERHQWSAALFNCHPDIYASVVDLIREFWPYQANDEFIRRVSLRFGVYYSAVWEEMGHLKYEVVNGS
ncbi:endonuclease domain-containing protein [Pantoea piersonii]|uniref:endonuclease domain-containing protein n=1 Tax=Pantoea piersonii TaxID=2364647 RepID=UPI0028992D4B|nr:endonuclease domain-containing protein [Pantoea piersonii]